eukprot:SAG25_NODE_162_length_13200_cov_4.969163_4_plen_70_part_00
MCDVRPSKKLSAVVQTTTEVCTHRAAVQRTKVAASLLTTGFFTCSASTPFKLVKQTNEINECRKFAPRT